MLRPKIGLDWDDVTAPFNSLAIAMANEKYQFDPPLRLEEIDSWANKGRAGVIKEFYGQEELYLRQQVPERNRKAVRRLMEIADVYFITAVYPPFMGIRARQITEAFPELPGDRIILGSAKNLVHFDIILDDAIHNVLESPAEYPVLLRKPWNWKMTGLLSVNNLTEFVPLVRQIIRSSQNHKEKIPQAAVLALVGPSGSGKSRIAQQLRQDPRFTSPLTYATRPSNKHVCLAEEDFNRQQFFEKTRYAGVQYGTRKEDIEAVLSQGRYAVMPLDMCGAIAMKRHFPTLIIYVQKDKESLIRDIVESDFSTEEKTLRLLSIDAEKRNREICDYAIDNNEDRGAELIRTLLHLS